MTVASGTALDPARFAIAGMRPRAAVRPASREELAATLEAAARDGDPVGVNGVGDVAVVVVLTP